MMWQIQQMHLHFCEATFDKFKDHKKFIFFAVWRTQLIADGWSYNDLITTS